MTTLREQIDRLTPEEYAREARAAALDAKTRAEELKIPVPTSILKLLNTPEAELARQRAKAIKTKKLATASSPTADVHAVPTRSAGDTAPTATDAESTSQPVPPESAEGTAATPRDEEPANTVDLPARRPRGKDRRPARYRAAGESSPVVVPGELYFALGKAHVVVQYSAAETLSKKWTKGHRTWRDPSSSSSVANFIVPALGNFDSLSPGIRVLADGLLPKMDLFTKSPEEVHKALADLKESPENVFKFRSLEEIADKVSPSVNYSATAEAALIISKILFDMDEEALVSFEGHVWAISKEEEGRMLWTDFDVETSDPSQSASRRR